MRVTIRADYEEKKRRRTAARARHVPGGRHRRFETACGGPAAAHLVEGTGVDAREALAGLSARPRLPTGACGLTPGLLFAALSGRLRRRKAA